MHAENLHTVHCTGIAQVVLYGRMFSKHKSCLLDRVQCAVIIPQQLCVFYNKLAIMTKDPSKTEFCLFEEKLKIADKTSRDIPL